MNRDVNSFIVVLLAALALCIFSTGSLAESPELSPEAPQDDPAWIALYADYIRQQTDAGIRCFMTMGDIDLDGVPELLVGVNDPLNPEVRVDVLSIVDGRVTRAGGQQINGAFSLKSASLVLYRSKKEYIWLLTTTGLDAPKGMQQTRYTQLKFQDGGFGHTNRFTRRWTGKRKQFFVDGTRVGTTEYNRKYKDFREKSKRIARMPVVSLGGADVPPAEEQLIQSLAQLSDKYQQMVKPEKIKLVGKSQRMKRGTRDRPTIGILPAYASLVRGTPVWESSDPDVFTVSAKGTVKAVGYGEAVISAKIACGTVARAHLTVPRPKVTKMKIQAESARLRKGEELQLYVKLTPSSARAKLKWTSSDPSVATVDEETGLVTAMKRGKVRIVCSVHKKMKTGINLTVTNGALVESVEISEPGQALQIGEYMALSAQVLPENATNKQLDWRSSNTRVASVNDAGWVTAQNAGEAIISAEALGGARASVRVTVTEQDHEKRAALQDGVYKLTLKITDAFALSVKDYSKEKRAPLQLEPDANGANQRFLIQNVDDNQIELRPLIAPDMYLCVYQDPSAENLGLRLGLMAEATEAERRFFVTRLTNGCFAFQLASDPEQSFGASRSREGESVQVMPYTETKAERRFLLSRLAPLPSATPGEDQWADNIRKFLTDNSAEMTGWSHLQLCDLDFDSVPELIIYTDKRNKGMSYSLTVRQALIYSPETDTVSPVWFEYEPGPNDDLKDDRPLLRLLISGETKRRSWVLTDGATGADRGSQRYVRIVYDQGVPTSEPLFEKSWKPAVNTSQGLSSELFFFEGVEVSRYLYGVKYLEYFKDDRWGASVQADVDCQGKPLEDVLAQLNIFMASKKWYA